jgi:hypothetical protein
MAAFGYLIYLLRVNQPHRAKELQRLSAAGDNDDDLLDLIQNNLVALGPGYQREPKTAEGYRVKLVDRRGRSLFVRLNKGPEGAPGETYNVETEESIETTEKQAQLSGLRALFVIPKDSYYGLLFVERVGVRHLKEVMANVAIRPAGQQSGVVTRIESFAEAKDWAAELAGKQALRMSELLEVTSTAQDASTPDDTTVRVITEGGLLKQASGKIKEKITERLEAREGRLDALARASDLARKRAATKDAFTVQDEAELQALTESIAAMNKPLPVDEDLQGTLSGLVPVDRSMLKHKRFDVSLGTERAERTFVIESDAVPQFVYELGGRLTDAGLRDAWTAHAESILSNRGVTLPAGWNKPDKE